MKLVFDKAGKYMNDYRIMEVTEDHVKDEAVFKVDEKNGTDYVRVKKAHVFLEADEDTKPVEIGDMSVKQLEEFAAGVEPVIDLSEAKNKAEKLAIIKAEIEVRKAALEATKTDD